MKKRMTALFLTAAMAAAVAGCSQKTTEVKDTSAAAVSSEAKQEEGTKASADGKESQAAGEKVKISYLSRFTNPELPRAKYYMEKLEEFRAANPDIEVEDVSIAARRNSTNGFISTECFSSTKYGMPHFSKISRAYVP